MRVSIVIPVLNESAHIETCLRNLQLFRAEGHEIIVVDGGSRDDTVARAGNLADSVIQAPRGRANQMNAGLAIAKGDVVLFLHVDTTLPENACVLVQKALGMIGLWGRFDVRLSGRGPAFRVIEFFMNRRSRLTGIATGDQAIFVRSEVLRKHGGYSNIPLMEDIDLSRRLKHLARPACLRQRVTTSSRRWEQGGVLRTVLLMWRLRFAYWRGVEPAKLAALYRN
jgi:rSAM/selenodomain-associated transferase 2